MSQDEAVAIRLRRNTTSTPWGFRMQGGNEYGTTLFIQKVSPKSLAYRQGLRLNDRILAIGNVQAHGMSHEQAKMDIIRAGNELDLIVQRKPGQDQTDNRPVRRAPEQSQLVEESTEYRGYTNPNVQSRSFRILQESLSYSEANEEGMPLPPSHTPGEGVVRRAYSEGRRRLEELREINPRNFTAEGESPYRYNTYGMQDDDPSFAEQVPVVSTQHAAVHSSKKVTRGSEPAPAPVNIQLKSSSTPVNIAASSVLSPAGSQQEYLAQAHQHYQGQQPDRPLKLVNYQFDQQYGHLNQGAVNGQQQPQVQQQYVQPNQGSAITQQQTMQSQQVQQPFGQQYGHLNQGSVTVQQQPRQPQYIQPQQPKSQSSDFIPATKTVSSVAEDLDLRHMTSPSVTQNVTVVDTAPVQQQEPRKRRQRVRPVRPEGQATTSPVPPQQSQPAPVGQDSVDGICVSKPSPKPESSTPAVIQTIQKPVEQSLVEAAQPKAEDAAQQSIVQSEVIKTTSGEAAASDTIETDVPSPVVAVEENIVTEPVASQPSAEEKAEQSTVSKTESSPVKAGEQQPESESIAVPAETAAPESTEKENKPETVPVITEVEPAAADAEVSVAQTSKTGVNVSEVKSETVEDVSESVSVSVTSDQAKLEEAVTSENIVNTAEEVAITKSDVTETADIHGTNEAEAVTTESAPVETTVSDTSVEAKTENTATQETSADTVLEVANERSDVTETANKTEVLTMDTVEVAADETESEVTLSVSADVDSSTSLSVNEDAQISISMSNDAETTTVLQLEDTDQNSESVTLSVSDDAESEVVIENVEFSADTSADANDDSATELTLSMDVEDDASSSQADTQSDTAPTKVDDKTSED